MRSARALLLATRLGVPVAKAADSLVCGRGLASAATQCVGRAVASAGRAPAIYFILFSFAILDTRRLSRPLAHLAVARRRPAGSRLLQRALDRSFAASACAPNLWPTP